jgi:hypothetical protein
MMAKVNDRWREHAACRGKDTGWWMADGRTDAGHLARTLCGTCPIRADCAAQALDALMSARLLVGHDAWSSWYGRVSLADSADWQFAGRRRGALEPGERVGSWGGDREILNAVVNCCRRRRRGDVDGSAGSEALLHAATAASSKAGKPRAGRIRTYPRAPGLRG